MSARVVIRRVWDAALCGGSRTRRQRKKNQRTAKLTDWFARSGEQAPREVSLQASITYIKYTGWLYARWRRAAELIGRAAKLCAINHFALRCTESQKNCVLSARKGDITAAQDGRLVN